MQLVGGGGVFGAQSADVAAARSSPKSVDIFLMVLSETARLKSRPPSMVNAALFRLCSLNGDQAFGLVGFVGQAGDVAEVGAEITVDVLEHGGTTGIATELRQEAVA